jgi:hypothetical protein
MDSPKTMQDVLKSFNRQRGASVQAAEGSPELWQALCRLRAEANTVLSRLRRARPARLAKEKADWARLRCSDVEYTLTATPDGAFDAYFRVLVLSASPEAAGIKRYLAERLVKFTDVPVIVTTDWEKTND